MALRVELPQNFQLSAIDRFTQQIVNADGSPKDLEVILDFRRLGFIDGSGYTVLSNTVGWLIHKGVKCSFDNFKDTKKGAISYLSDCGFFKKYIGYDITPIPRTRDTTLPCVSIEQAQAFSWIENSFSPWMEYTLFETYGSLSSLRSCIKELFNNIGDHSMQNTGFVHVQHYPNLKRVNITVSDFGIGIPHSIRAKYGDMTDAEAIYLASQEGITAQSRPNNMGAGLNYVIDRITGMGGNVLIHSLGGNLTCSRENNRQIRKRSSGRGSYPGTLIDIGFDTRLFVGDDDDRGEVEW